MSNKNPKKQQKPANNKKTVAKGRPTKYSKLLAQEIASDIRTGVTPEVAAMDRGISTTTYYDWMQKGKEGIAPFTEFSELITRAKYGLRKFVEQRLFAEHPTFYARHAPNMREKDGVEGWNGYENKDTNIQVVTVSSIVDSAFNKQPIDVLDYKVEDVDDEIQYIGEDGNNK